jgi:pimeloyl-ACP methyl ester carboxylesterase
MTGYGRKFGRCTAILVVGGILTVSDSRGEMDMQKVSPPAHEGMVKLADSHIQYFSQGQGKPIVLLPFGGLTVGYMAGLSQDLADAGYRVIRINFRGSGKSTGSGEDITLHTLAQDVAGVIGSLNLGPVNVGGHAFGNRVARTLAADHPEIVHSVILFAAGGKIPPKPPGEQALQTIFNPASTNADILKQMKYMVGNPAEIPMAWKAIKPSRAPEP